MLSGRWWQHKMSFLRGSHVDVHEESHGDNRDNAGPFQSVADPVGYKCPKKEASDFHSRIQHFSKDPIVHHTEDSRGKAHKDGTKANNQEVGNVPKDFVNSHVPLTESGAQTLGDSNGNSVVQEAFPKDKDKYGIRLTHVEGHQDGENGDAGSILDIRAL